MYIRLILNKTKNTTKRPLSHIKKNGSKCHKICIFPYKTQYKAKPLIMSAVKIEISFKFKSQYSNLFNNYFYVYHKKTSTLIYIYIYIRGCF